MLRPTLSLGALGLMGFVVAVVGTAGHRVAPYWGTALVFLLVLSASTYARAWKSWLGLVVFSQVWLVTVLFLVFWHNPTGSIAIVDDALGKLWLYGGAVAVTLPAFIPRRLLQD